MKLRTLGAATLVAALAAGTLLPTGVLAENSHTSDGTIRYEQTTGGDPGDVTDPEDGDDIDEPETNPNHDPLMIIGATSYDFIDKEAVDEEGKPLEKVEIVEGLKLYDAAPFQKTVDGEAAGTARHFVEFRDIRATEAVRLSRNYDISAAITTPFTFTTDNGNGEDIVLKGAEILYNDVQFLPQFGSDYETGVSGEHYTLTNSVRLSQGGENATEPGASATFLDVHSSGTNAAGRFHLAFGAERPAEDATHDSGVQLEVPGGQIITEGDYSATITWTIADTPTGGTETGEEAGA